MQLATIKRKIKAHMATHKMSEFKFAKEINMSQQGFKNFMRRKGGTCNKKTLEKIAAYLELPEVKKPTTEKSSAVQTLPFVSAQGEKVNLEPTDQIGILCNPITGERFKINCENFHSENLHQDINLEPLVIVTGDEPKKPFNWKPFYVVAPWLIAIGSLAGMLGWGYHG